jgi:hypothetical protein
VVDPVNNSPRPFAQRDVMHLRGRYPLWIDGSLVGSRAQVLMQYAFQGQFFDAAMHSLTVQLMAYNADSDRLVDQRVRFTRNHGGCFDITKEARSLQVRRVVVRPGLR